MAYPGRLGLLHRSFGRRLQSHQRSLPFPKRNEYVWLIRVGVKTPHNITQTFHGTSLALFLHSQFCSLSLLCDNLVTPALAGLTTLTMTASREPRTTSFVRQTLPESLIITEQEHQSPRCMPTRSWKPLTFSPGILVPFAIFTAGLAVVLIILQR
jgi:hypothetical protein